MAIPRTVRVNPASGDDHASLTVNGEPIASVDKGTILKVLGASGSSYKVEYDPTIKDEDNVPMGGISSKGVIAADPYTYMYNNQYKHKSLGRLNNGTPIEILELPDKGMYKVSGLTTNGMREGYVEPRFIYRAADE